MKKVMNKRQKKGVVLIMSNELNKVIVTDNLKKFNHFYNKAMTKISSDEKFKCINSRVLFPMHFGTNLDNITKVINTRSIYYNIRMCEIEGSFNVNHKTITTSDGCTTIPCNEVQEYKVNMPWKFLTATTDDYIEYIANVLVSRIYVDSVKHQLEMINHQRQELIVKEDELKDALDGLYFYLI